MAEMITMATVGLTSFLWAQIEKYGPGLVAKVKNKVAVEKAVSEYLSRYLDSYGAIKPIGITYPIPLEKIYTEVQFTTENLREQFSAKGLEQSAIRDLRKTIDSSSFKTLPGISAANDYQRLLVLGHPGGGKSTFLRRVGWECLRTHGIIERGHSGEPKYAYPLLPVLVELKRCRKNENRTLLQLIVQEFAICGFPESEVIIEAMLKEGSVLVLLDALDEVAQERVEPVIGQSLELVREYPLCRFVISCRVAFPHDYFSNFQDVRLLDFTDAQIEGFIKNWFSSAEQRESEIAEKFVEQLHSPQHTATLELARSPVLLGYLCVTYQATLALSTNRAEIYRRALDIYLQEWNARELKMSHTEQAHPSLPHESEMAMLAAIAFEALTTERFFLSKDEWLNAIRRFMADLVEKPKSLSTEEILKKIAVSQGLVVQRTHQDWSFSHLTLQEYLAAYHIEQNDLMPYIVEKYLGVERWREVFLIMAGMKPNRLLQCMIQTANKRIAKHEPEWEAWCKHFSVDGPEQDLEGILNLTRAKILGLCLYLHLNYLNDRPSDTHVEGPHYFASELLKMGLYEADEVSVSAGRIAPIHSGLTLYKVMSPSSETEGAASSAFQMVADMSKSHRNILVHRRFNKFLDIDLGSHWEKESLQQVKFELHYQTALQESLCDAVLSTWPSVIKSNKLGVKNFPFLSVWNNVAEIRKKLDEDVSKLGTLAMDSMTSARLPSLRNPVAVSDYFTDLRFIVECKTAAARVPLRGEWVSVLKKFLTWEGDAKRIDAE